jgi:hypothetical protein
MELMGGICTVCGRPRSVCRKDTESDNDHFTTKVYHEYEKSQYSGYQIGLINAGQWDRMGRPVCLSDIFGTVLGF